MGRKLDVCFFPMKLKSIGLFCQMSMPGEGNKMAKPVNYPGFTYVTVGDCDGLLEITG